MSSSQIINGNRFANQARNSFLPCNANLYDSVIWNTAFPQKINTLSPMLISIVDDKLLLTCRRGLIAIESESGTILWHKELFNFMEPEINSRGICTVDENHYLKIFSFKGELLIDTHLPVLIPVYNLFCFDETSTHFLMLLNRYPRSFDNPEPSAYTISKFSKQNREFDIYQEGKELATGYAKSPDGQFIFMSTFSHLYKIPVEAKNEKDIHTFNINSIHSLSFDHSGNILLIRTDQKKGSFLYCYNVDGQHQWDICFTNKTPDKQPPAISPDGFIFVSAESVLYCIKDGKLLWEYSLSPDSNQNILMTVMKNNTVIAVSQKSIYHLSTDGKLLFSRLNSFPVTCRPAIDKNGNVFLSGDEGILCLR